MSQKVLPALLTGALMVGAVTALPVMPAFADGDGSSLGGPLAKERFQIRLRGIGVLPDDEGDVETVGGTPDPDDGFAPELDITYFFTDHIGIELIAATTKHDIELKDSSLGASTDLGEVWLLPPTLTLQYHVNRDWKFSPYIGAGVNFTLPYGEDEAGGAITDLEADSAFGVAAQIGFDYWINENWGLNFDVKKIWLEIDATVNNSIDAELELDPWVVGAGVSYRF